MERRVVIWNVVSKVINRKTREKEEYRDYDFVGAESRAGFRSRPVHTGTGTGLDGRKCWDKQSHQNRRRVCWSWKWYVDLFIAVVLHLASFFRSYQGLYSPKVDFSLRGSKLEVMTFIGCSGTRVRKARFVPSLVTSLPC